MAGFDAGGIDEVIHGRMRLGVMAYLAQSEPAGFTELAQALGATNGNLSVHLTRLERAGYVSISKGARGVRPHTEVRLTHEGRAAWDAYLATMRTLFPD